MPPKGDPHVACKVKIVDIPEGKTWRHVRGFFESNVIIILQLPMSLIFPKLNHVLYFSMVK